MSKVVSRGGCPSCDSSDAFTTFTEGPPKCFSCGYIHRTRDKMKEYREGYKEKKVDISLYRSYPIKALTHKPIPKEICERYGVRVGVSEQDGETVERVYYPYYDDSNTIVGYKIRTIPKEFYGEGKTSKVKLFGQQLFDDKKRKMLIITEGEDDALAVATMLQMRNKDYPVVSICSGANTSEVGADIKHNYEYIVGHETVMLCFDNDKVGQAYAKLVAEFLCGACTVKIVNLPELKDASDYLIEGKVEQFAKCMGGAKEYSPEAIVRGQDVVFEDLRKPKQKGYDLPYPELQNKLKGLRKGELTLLTAGSGIGKSSLAREVAYHMVKEHNLTIGNIYLETPMEDAASAFIAMDNAVSPAKYWFNPSTVSETEARRSYEQFIASGRLHFFKHFGSIATDKLLTKLNYFAKVLAVDFIILDHISMVISGEDSRDERKDIDILMTNLAKFCVETGVGVIAVVHLKRVPGKNYNTGDEVELVDLRGSGGLEQMSWNVISLERDQQGESKDFSKCRVLKNRTFGYTGLCDTLQYSHDTGRLLPVNMEGY